jgi:hypothetical protein
MERYKDLYLWMIVPMVIMQLGIASSYWVGVAGRAWSVHIHHWTATLWYGYLIVQPYFATHGQLSRHRTNGIIGFFLAGGVALTALSMQHGDIARAERAAQTPDLFDPIEPWFFYGIATVEFVIMAAFIFAVIQAILHRHSLNDHVWWLISTAFIITGGPQMKNGNPGSAVSWAAMFLHFGNAVEPAAGFETDHPFDGFSLHAHRRSPPSPLSSAS